MKKKKTITHGSGNAYFLRPVALHLFIGDVQPEVHLTLVIGGAQRDVRPNQCIPLPFGNDCDHTVLFPRCLPCLSRRWTHNQTSSATMDKCTSQKVCISRPMFIRLFFSCFGGYYHLPKYSTFYLTPCIMSHSLSPSLFLSPIHSLTHSLTLSLSLFL